MLMLKVTENFVASGIFVRLLRKKFHMNKNNFYSDLAISVHNSFGNRVQITFE